MVLVPRFAVRNQTSIDSFDHFFVSNYFPLFGSKHPKAYSNGKINNESKGFNASRVPTIFKVNFQVATTSLAWNLIAK